MNDRQLRNRLIRLAHAKPEMREHLLPLIQEKQAGSIGEIFPKVVADVGPGGVSIYTEMGLTGMKFPDAIKRLQQAWNLVDKASNKIWKALVRDGDLSLQTNNMASGELQQGSKPWLVRLGKVYYPNNPEMEWDRFDTDLAEGLVQSSGVKIRNVFK